MFLHWSTQGPGQNQKVQEQTEYNTIIRKMQSTRLIIFLKNQQIQPDFKTNHSIARRVRSKSRKQLKTNKEEKEKPLSSQ